MGTSSNTLQKTKAKTFQASSSTRAISGQRLRLDRLSGLRLAEKKPTSPIRRLKKCPLGTSPLLVAPSGQNKIRKL